MTQTIQRVLLAGPRGCIGRAFQAYMQREHPDVQVVPLLPFPFSMQSVGESLRNGAFTHFVNCAALGHDTDSQRQPYPYFDTNVAGVTKHLEMIRQHSPTTRYLNLGTIYETDPARQSPYVTTKRMVRQAVESYRRNHGLYAVTATLGFTEYYGRPESGLARRIAKGVAAIADALNAGRSFEPLTLWDIDQAYVWTWAEDVADGMWRMLAQGEPRDYTLMSADCRTVRSFVESAFAAVDIKGVWWRVIISPDHEEYLLSRDGRLATSAYRPLARVESARRIAEVTAPASEMDRARAELGWSPRVSFDELVTRMVRADMDAYERAPICAPVQAQQIAA